MEKEKGSRTIFNVALRSISFAWETNKLVFGTLICLNIFLGSIVYLQFTSFSSIVDEIILIKQGQSTFSNMIPHVLLLATAFIIPTVAQNIVAFFRAKFRLDLDLRLDLFKIDKQGELDIGTIESNSYQTLLRSAQEWGSGSMLALQDFILTSASSFAGIITSMLILWSLSGWLVLFALAAAAPVYFFYKKYSMEVYRIRYFSIDDHRVISNRISHFEQLQKAVDVILLKLKGWLKKQVGDRMRDYNSKIIKAEQRKAISYSFLSLWYLLFLFAAIGLMTYYALNGIMAVGALLLAFNTYTRFYQTVNGYVESISWTEEASRYAARWFELFDVRPKIVSKKDAIPFDHTKPPLIEFRNVSFRYPKEEKENPYVLQDLNFTFSPGEKIAIVGVNGAGKTTLIKLLCRVYDPTDGSILVNGTDLRDLKLEDWQSSIGILFQDFPIYNLTIRESIGVGRIAEEPKQEQLDKAAKYSGADEFIDGNYEQLIWKEFRDGIDLSKGQHQRLAVARMFYRNAAITILDEPTASIDAVTEEKIFRSLEKHMEGKSVILITHRFSTVKNADKILMMEHGKIIEQGSHRELMEVNGKYAELYTMQAKRYLEEEKENVKTEA
ncbi:MAG TPA: ABC transporter ATP-binding protein [Cyclobacteriaceae bacterium]|nr:ABC transporter ATP-binding protein [Cyclobacteriaceae bacterium]